MKHFAVNVPKPDVLQYAMDANNHFVQDIL
jgi:hypothetical protein